MRKVFMFLVLMVAVFSASGCDGGSEKSAPTVSTYSVTVDYSYSLAEMIAAGNYDYVNPNITEARFSISGKGKAELKLELVHFNRYISSDDAIAELKKRGLRPATLPELLAFGEKYPAEQRKYPIVALGSVWRSGFGLRRVACLYRWRDLRHLNLGWFGGDCRKSCRFLAFRDS